MPNFNFKQLNLILGWFVFFIALITYWLTVEPTASFWDAGEYIATSSKLQVGHPPGAPLYQIFGAFFSIFWTFICEKVFIFSLTTLIPLSSDAFNSNTLFLYSKSPYNSLANFY